jgi:hypothetical protein
MAAAAVAGIARCMGEALMFCQERERGTSMRIEERWWTGRPVDAASVHRKRLAFSIDEAKTPAYCFLVSLIEVATK